MSSKLEEKRAWKKLLAYPDGVVKVLQLEYVRYTHSAEAFYKAYISEAKPFGWSGIFDNPMDAVDSIINMMEETKNGQNNRPAVEESPDGDSEAGKE